MAVYNRTDTNSISLNIPRMGATPKNSNADQAQAWKKEIEQALIASAVNAEKLQQRMTTLEAEQDRVTQELNQTQGELEVTQNDLRGTKKKLDQTKSELKKTQLKLDKTNTALGKVEHKCNEARYREYVAKAQLKINSIDSEITAAKAGRIALLTVGSATALIGFGIPMIAASELAVVPRIEDLKAEKFALEKFPESITHPDIKAEAIRMYEEYYHRYEIADSHRYLDNRLILAFDEPYPDLSCEEWAEIKDKIEEGEAKRAVAIACANAMTIKDLEFKTALMRQEVNLKLYDGDPNIGLTKKEKQLLKSNEAKISSS